MVIEDNSNPCLLRGIRLTNLLSFSGESEETAFGALNLLIGPNGSGKSNLIDAIDLLRSTPKNLSLAISNAGGAHDLLWKSGEEEISIASIDAVIAYPCGITNLRHQIALTTMRHGFELTRESIERDVFVSGARLMEGLYYSRDKRSTYVRASGLGEAKQVKHQQFSDEQSILSQLRDPVQYPEITYLAKSLEEVRIYREWRIGRKNPARSAQRADLPNKYLAEDASNLGLILNRFEIDFVSKQRVLKELRELYEGIDDYKVLVEGGSVQVFLQEGSKTIPATRLSDGTLRYLCLLAILCHPDPPPLVCIEEPELGLHPDIMPALAQLLKEASTRSQLIVTTHSDELVDAMTDQPESVLVCEKDEHGTTLNRLNAETLKPWLEKYRLGELWTKGEIGGTRW